MISKNKMIEREKSKNDKKIEEVSYMNEENSDVES